jgi:hypothetical protein
MFACAPAPMTGITYPIEPSVAQVAPGVAGGKKSNIRFQLPLKQ